MPKHSGPVLVPVAPGSDPVEVTLVFFPGAGAGPGYFHQWRTAVPADWALVAVNLPGRGSRFAEPFARDLVSVANEIAVALGQLHASQLVLLGHSFGAILALEVAIRLPEPPRLLATAGCPAPPAEPITYRREPTREDDLMLARLLLQQVAPELEESVFEEMVQITAPVCRADMELLRGYRRPDQQLNCDVISFYAEQDYSDAEVWQELTARRARTVVVPGDHLTFGQSSRDVIIGHLCAALNVRVPRVRPD